MAVKAETITESIEPIKAVKKLDTQVAEEEEEVLPKVKGGKAVVKVVSKWKKPYEPPPVVDQSTVLIIGFLIFGLAVLWPPLILLVAYVVSKLVPYSL